MGDRWPATAFAGDRSPPRSGAYSQYTHTHTHTHTQSHTHTHTHTHARTQGIGSRGGWYIVGTGELSAGNNSFRGERGADRTGYVLRQ